MRALVVPGKGEPAALAERDAPVAGDGEVVLSADWSSVNYKDAMAAAGRPGILRSTPMVPGIDVAGTADDGTEWVVVGAGLGERRDGGFAERVAVERATAVRVPEGFGTRGAAAIGTAGVTAALSVLALERAGLPDGPVLVTGAGGGVGGFAIALLAATGREVHASTGRAAELEQHLRALGAAAVVDRRESEPGRPLQQPQWAGVVDSVGGGPLVNALAQTLPGGVVAACGLAASPDLPGSVLPFILRGVTLTGVYSVDLPTALRRAAWDLLVEHVSPETVELLVDREIGLAEVPQIAPDVLAGRIRGRVLVAPQR